MDDILLTAMRVFVTSSTPARQSNQSRPAPGGWHTFEQRSRDQRLTV